MIPDFLGPHQVVGDPPTEGSNLGTAASEGASHSQMHISTAGDAGVESTQAPPLPKLLSQAPGLSGTSPMTLMQPSDLHEVREQVEKKRKEPPLLKN